MEICQGGNFEVASCSAMVREACALRVCNLLHTLQLAPNTHLSQALTATAPALCHVPPVADPFKVEVLPLDGTRFYNDAIPLYVSVALSPEVSSALQQDYSDKCYVHASLNGLEQMVEPVRRFIEGQGDLAEAGHMLQVGRVTLPR